MGEATGWKIDDGDTVAQVTVGRINVCARSDSSGYGWCIRIIGGDGDAPAVYHEVSTTNGVINPSLATMQACALAAVREMLTCALAAVDALDARADG
jgi:hypothetical protein